MTSNLVLEPPQITYDKSAFVFTKFGNKISKTCELKGTEKIAVRGKTIIEANATVRGDLAPIHVGSCCIIGEGVTLQPPPMTIKGNSAHLRQDIGDYVVIEEGTTVEACKIGAYSHIEKGCVIGARAIVSGCCLIKAGTVIPPRAVIPPFSVVSGPTGTIERKLPSSFQWSMIEICDSFYKNFVPSE